MRIHPFALFGLAVSCGAVQAEQRIACPAEVTSSQMSVRAPAGWTGFYAPDIKLRLQGAGAMLGPLKLMGVLQGEVTQKGEAVVHRFDMTGGVSDQLEKWMVCTYKGNVYQAFKLPMATRACTVTYRRDADPKADPPYAVGSILCE